MYLRTKEKLYTPPTCEPITIDEARVHCRVLDNNDDGYLAGLITAARQHLEEVCWSSFITQTWQYWFDRFATEMRIPRAPLRYGITLQSVVSFQYVAPSTPGTATYIDVPADRWEISALNQIPFLRQQHLKTWPITRGYRDDVTVTVTSGYGDKPSDVPMPIRQAIKLLVGHMYLVRGDEPPQEIPPAINHLVQNYRFKEM